MLVDPLGAIYMQSCPTFRKSKKILTKMSIQ